MEPEGSIPNSQELSTCPYPDKITSLRVESFVLKVKPIVEV
jgi:hypothetical protein